MYILNYNNVI